MTDLRAAIESQVAKLRERARDCEERAAEYEPETGNQNFGRLRSAMATYEDCADALDRILKEHAGEGQVTDEMVAAGFKACEYRRFDKYHVTDVLTFQFIRQIIEAALTSAVPQSCDEIERLRDALNKTSARNRTLARKLRRRNVCGVSSEQIEAASAAFEKWVDGFTSVEIAIGTRHGKRLGVDIVRAMLEAALAVPQSEARTSTSLVRGYPDDSSIAPSPVQSEEPKADPHRCACGKHEAHEHFGFEEFPGHDFKACKYNAISAVAKDEKCGDCGQYLSTNASCKRCTDEFQRRFSVPAQPQSDVSRAVTPDPELIAQAKAASDMLYPNMQVGHLDHVRALAFIEGAKWALAQEGAHHG